MKDDIRTEKEAVQVNPDTINQEGDQKDIHREKIREIFHEISKVVIGQDALLSRLLIGLFTNGHILLEGVPGIAKTLMVSTLARVLHLDFQRIQVTPDLLPADLVGTMIYNQKKAEFEVKKGPIFSNIILADEVNRSPAKVQSALLEAMQEKTVTIGETTYKLDRPFLVMATQNPIDQEGTYPLPEAQLDRFFHKLVVQYSGREELAEILNRTTTGFKPEIKAVMSGAEIVSAQKLIKRIIVAPHVQDYIIRAVLATHPGGQFAVEITNKYVRWGSSPRGAQSVTLAAKVQALLDGRYSVSFSDVEKVYLPCLRHRTLLNFEGQAEGIDGDDVLKEILEGTPTMSEAAA